jgi:SNF2 family DNA or RNA helicase
VSTAKLELLDDTLEDILGAGEKVVVFCRFTAELIEISRGLTRNKVKHDVLNGETKDRGGVVERFQTDPETKVLVCQISVGGVGITLVSASVVIFYSTTFSLIDYLQAVGRIHRIGQSKRCLYINLLAERTVDEHIIAAVAAKKNLSDNVVDNWRSIIAGGAENAED